MKALGSKCGRSEADGTVCPKKPEVEKDGGKSMMKSIARQLKRAQQDPKYTADRMLASHANTDPEDLFP